jgi:hypothetical protein
VPKLARKGRGRYNTYRVRGAGLFYPVYSKMCMPAPQRSIR